MKHYISVLVPQTSGGWRAHFPDFPGCRAEGAKIEMAIARASSAAREEYDKLKLNGGPPRPRNLDEIRADESWAADQAVDWKTAVVCLVPVESG